MKSSGAISFVGKPIPDDGDWQSQFYIAPADRVIRCCDPRFGSRLFYVQDWSNICQFDAIKSSVESDLTSYAKARCQACFVYWCKNWDEKKILKINKTWHKKEPFLWDVYHFTSWNEMCCSLSKHLPWHFLKRVRLRCVYVHVRYANFRATCNNSLVGHELNIPFTAFTCVVKTSKFVWKNLS
jgi:hypothetical protein